MANRRNDDVYPEFMERLQELNSLSELMPSEFATFGMYADRIAQEEKGMKMTQLRRFFHEIDRLYRTHARGKEDNDQLGDEFRTDMYLLHPELAYACGRGLVSKGFMQMMQQCLSERLLKTVGDLKRLREFMAAIVAYRKFHGG